MIQETCDAPEAMPEQIEKMDRMYRYQRHFYDFTRKYYLLGRDRLLQRMDVKPGETVLEMACGTARNLFKLARLQPEAKLYGIDASAEMLKTAHERMAKRPYLQGVQLKQELAENVTYRGTFGLEKPFDVVFCSYGLSMIPTWHEAIHVSLENLKPGGIFYIVDFWDQAELPRVFRAALVRWLELFGVHFRPELITYLHEISEGGVGPLEVESIGRRYAYIAKLHKRADGVVALAASGAE